MAHANTPDEQSTATGTATIRGHIADPTGALIPGVKVTVSTAAGIAVTSVTADALGVYTVTGLKPGGYIVGAEVTGFAPFSSPTIQLTAGQNKRVDIAMAIEVEQQSVTVSDDEDAPTVSTEAGANASALVIKGKDLEALSDDPDELSNELSALAGPSAGPNGGQIYIDGFTGGQLPPKSAIREIRINQNPFSAEFDRLGYGRIEILTKPGTDKLHGRVFGQGNSSYFNTGNPFTTELPNYYSYQYNGTVSGALSKTASWFISVEQRNNQSDNVYYLKDGPIFTGATATCCYTDGLISGSLLNPGDHLNVSPRIDLQLGAKNTLTLRYQFFRNNQTNDLNGSTTLPSQALNSDSIEHTVQISDSQIINDHVVNETRFEYRRANSSQTPISTAPTLSIQGNSSLGGLGSQSNSSHADHFELQNITTMTAGAQAIKFGLWARDNREAISSDGNFNGSFTFPNITAFKDTWNGVYSPTAPMTVAQIAAACPTGTTCTPTKLTYTTGNLNYSGNVFDGALFIQDDWKKSQFLTLSGGLRFETQNHIADHFDDWGPRFALAYAVDGHKDRKQAKTVLRAGAGFFYDRFQVSNLLQNEQLNGKPGSQKQYVITNPQCFSGTSFTSISIASCGTSNATTSETQITAPHYHSPYAEQFGVSLERQLTKASTLTATYLRSFGVHQLVTNDANAYLPGTFEYYNQTAFPGTRPNPSLGVVEQWFPEAVYKQNQVIVSVNARFTSKLNVTGFYNLTDGHSDGGAGSNASNSYNLSQDYGRAGFIRPQNLTLIGSYTGPWNLIFNPFMIAQSGRPYNVTSPYDLTGDNFFNDRPAYATAPLDPYVVSTNIGSLDTEPNSNEKLVPANYLTGPAGIAMNLRLTKAIGIGPKTGGPVGPNQRGQGPAFGGAGGGGGGRGGGGGGRGGFGGGGFGGGPGGGMMNTGHKYSLTFSVQALNLFNDINRGTPSGGLSPTPVYSTTNPAVITGYTPGAQFEQSSSLLQGFFSQGSASRRVFFQTSFSF